MWWESLWRWSNRKEQGISWVFCFRIFSFKVSAEAVIFSQGPTGEDLPPENHMVLAGIQFLVSGMTEGFTWVLTVGLGRPLQFLATWVSPCLLVWPLASLRQQEGKSVGKTYMTVLCNIVTDMTSHHHCHILLLDSNLRSAYAQGSIRTLKDLSVRKWR